MVETQFSRKVKTIRTDNGTEFIMKEFFAQRGILHQLSCVKTPQQNAIVERKHQHILNVARALKFQSNLPMHLWGYCILIAVYLINRVQTSILSHKTPFEVLFGHVPTYSHLKILGCLCYASTFSHNRSKFAPRARKCVFLGYPFGIKGYKLLDLSTNTVFVSKDMVFHEHIFAFAFDKCDFFYPFTIFFEVEVHSSGKDCTDSFVTPIGIIEVPTQYSCTCDSSFQVPDNPITVLPRSPSSIFESASLDSSQPNSASFIAPNPTPPMAVPPPIRKSTKAHQTPIYLQDYACNTAATARPPSLPYDIANSSTYSHLDPSYQSYLMTISACHQEPTSFSQAVQDLAWRATMDKEIVTLEKTHTWVLTPLPPGKSPIGCKWVYKIKLNPDGTMERYKACLVAKGYTQREDLDFLETFSLVAKTVSVRVFFALASAKG